MNRRHKMARNKEVKAWGGQMDELRAPPLRLQPNKRLFFLKVFFMAGRIRADVEPSRRRHLRRHLCSAVTRVH